MATFYHVTMQMANNEDLRQAFALTDSAGVPIDLTAASLDMDIDTPAGTAVLELSTANGRITVANAALGQFELVVPVAVMRTFPGGVYQHDLVLTQAGRVQRLFEGTLTVTQGVTENQ
jgi:hypothetical protein